VKRQPRHIVVLAGGQSPEREVSIESGRAVGRVLEQDGGRLLVLDENKIPHELDPCRMILFPLIHGVYGEDGRFQAEALEKGFTYVGCDREASRRCIDKQVVREIAGDSGIPVARGGIVNSAGVRNDLESVPFRTGPWILKPRFAGSSVGLKVIESREALAEAVTHCDEDWILEEKSDGFDLTVGILQGEVLGTVGIRPTTGIYDFEHKYEPGRTRYEVPASVPDQLKRRVEEAALLLYRKCHCRDFARVDFMVNDKSGDWILLEINTLPGMTETSLLPKCASLKGYDFPALVRAMVEPARKRFVEETG